MQVKHPIIVKNLYSVYNEKTTASVVAVKNFNYTFEQNKIYCIIGESGSGKSTLINYFNGLFKPTYGSLTINDIELNGKFRMDRVFLSKLLFTKRETLFILPNTFKFGIGKQYFLVQVPKDAREQEIKLTLRSYNPNTKSVYLKLNKINLKILGINNITHNKFYIIESENSLDDIPTMAHSSEFVDIKSSCRNKTTSSKKKIKNFKIIRRDVGMVYQFPEYQLFKNTVIEDVMFGPRNLGYNKPDAKACAITSLKQLGIDEKFHSNSPFGLSGGQKRRVAIAGILAINGNILIFDEPTAGLDPKGENEMIQIILNGKKQGKTVFVVTHSMNEVLKIADKILVLHNGQLVTDGTPYEVFNNSKIMQETSIEIPYVVRLVNKLISKNSQYKKLIELQPRTVEQLGEQIIKLKGASNVTNFK